MRLDHAITTAQERRRLKRGSKRHSKTQALKSPSIPFEHTPKGSTQSTTFRNIIGRIGTQQTQRVMIGTHYDTRSTADKDPDEARRSEPIIGANDGGSGVAVLLEMAELWKGPSRHQSAWI